MASSIPLSLVPLFLLINADLYTAAHGSVISSSRSFTVSEQGKNRCPDVQTGGEQRVSMVRSHLDCAKSCSLWSECLYYDYRRNNRNCTLYSVTPANLRPAEDCVFMLDPATFEGCFSTASMHIDPGGCSLPFQHSNQEFYSCMATNTTAQCVADNEQIADCIAPAGYTVQQDIVNWTSPVSGPLPCISSWIILMQRFSASVNFFRNWTEYKNGFGDIRGKNFWIGNENMHLITNGSAVTYRLRVEVQTWSTEFWYYAEYETFSIDSEADFYKLHLTNYYGNAGDSLSNTTNGPQRNHNGKNFSTYDADNDIKLHGSCATMFNGSWWFGNCYWSCLTCIYGTPYFSWFTLDTYGLQPAGRLRSARMMIRSN